jgi:hypothetical protein
VPEPSLVEVEIAIGKLKSYKFPGTDQILAKWIKAGGETLCSEIHKLICSIWNKEFRPYGFTIDQIFYIRQVLEKN